LPATASDDEGPADIDEFRLALVRKMSTFLGAWRTWDRPACERHHACLDNAMACTADGLRLTPQQSASAAISISNALQRVMLERERVDSVVGARKRGG
jgi:hypothetical protein